MSLCLSVSFCVSFCTSHHVPPPATISLSPSPSLSHLLTLSPSVSHSTRATTCRRRRRRDLSVSLSLCISACVSVCVSVRVSLHFSLHTSDHLPPPATRRRGGLPGGSTSSQLARHCTAAATHCSSARAAQPSHLSTAVTSLPLYRSSAGASAAQPSYLSHPLTPSRSLSLSSFLSRRQRRRRRAMQAPALPADPRRSKRVSGASAPPAGDRCDDSRPSAFGEEPATHTRSYPVAPRRRHAPLKPTHECYARPHTQDPRRDGHGRTQLTCRRQLRRARRFGRGACRCCTGASTSGGGRRRGALRQPLRQARFERERGGAWGVRGGRRLAARYKAAGD